MENTYFIWRFDEHHTYRVYGYHNHAAPDRGDRRVVWIGDGYHRALAECAAYNAKAKRAKDCAEQEKMAL